MANDVKSSVQSDTNDFSMIGAQTLVQNQIGIFYGILEKVDTRNGTALLRDGFMLSPDSHITYTEYLNFLEKELDQYVKSAEIKRSKSTKLNMPIQIIVSVEEFTSKNQVSTIADYASGGIAFVRHQNTFGQDTHVQNTLPYISLTGVSVIVPIISRVQFTTDYVSEANLEKILGNLDDILDENINILEFTAEETFSWIANSVNHLPPLLIEAI